MEMRSRIDERLGLVLREKGCRDGNLFRIYGITWPARCRESPRQGDGQAVRLIIRSGAAGLSRSLAPAPPPARHLHSRARAHLGGQADERRAATDAVHQTDRRFP